jgi:hypothetical protein
MTYEEMERTMAFILNQQAQFSSDMQQLREAQADFKDQFKDFHNELKEMKDVQDTFQMQLAKLTDITLNLAGLVNQIAESQLRTDQRLAETNERRRTTHQLSPRRNKVTLECGGPTPLSPLSKAATSRSTPKVLPVGNRTAG